MANTLDPMKPTYWSKRIQALLRVMNIARNISSFEEKSNLANGRQVNRPTMSDVSTEAITFGDGSYNRQDVSSVQESLIVNNWDSGVVTFTDDQMVQLLNAPARVNDFIDRVAFQLNRKLDRTVLAEVSNASFNTTPTIYTKSDIFDGFGNAQKVLEENGVEQDRPWYLAVDADVTKLIIDHMGNKVTDLGDDATLRGKFGFKKLFRDFQVFQANQALQWTGNINIATNPSDGDTIVIDGVTLTARTAPSVAGDFDIKGSAAATVTVIAAFINDPSTTSGDQIALSAADALKFVALGQILISAVDNTTSIALTSRRGRLTLAEIFTAVGDNVSDMILHCLGGRMGNIDLVLQKDIQTQKKDVSGAYKKDFATSFMWGLKTFSEGAQRMVDFQIRTAADTPTS